MDLELSGLNLSLAVLIMSRDVIEDGVDQLSNVGVLVLEKLKDNLDHVCVVDNVVPG